MLNKLIVKRSFCLCVCVMWIMYGASAQQQKVNFTSLTSKDGLSSNVVTAILKDRYGIMWFGTEDGLNKYDGTSFTVYRHNATDTSSLPSNDIIALHEDRMGNLWIGTNGGSVSVYDRQKDSFKSLRSYAGFDTEINVVKAICSDHLGHIWISNFEGLSVFNPATRQISRFTVDPAKKAQLSTKGVLSLFEDSKRRFWVGSDDGLFLYNRKQNSFLHYKHSPKDPASLAGNIVRSITEDGNGSIWIGTAQGVSMLMPDGRTFKNFRHQDGNNKTISSNEIYSVAVDSKRKLWVGTEEGVNVLDINTGEVTIYQPDSRDIHSLTSKSVRSVYIDSQGIYWIGTYKGGINKLDRNLNLFSLKLSIPFDARGLSASNVTSFAEDGNGDVFVGTDGGGLNLFHRQTSLFSHFTLLPKGRSTSAKLSVLALEMGKDKRLWVGTYADGLFVLDPQTGKYEQFVQNGKSGGLTNNNVFCLKEDSRGNIWVGTNGGGVNVYHPKTQTFSAFHENESLQHVIQLPINGYIRAIEEDSKGNMWIGSHGSGIAVFNPETKSVKVYDRGNSKLPTNVVLSVMADRHQNVWVGTLGGGLSLFDKKTNRFISFSEKDGLANGVVYSIVEDEKGLLWVSTNSGISSFDLKTRKFKNYNKYNGVQNNNFNRGAGMRMADGELFFGGLEGFNYFNPGNVKTISDVPPVLITELKVDNKTIIPADKSPIKEHISVTKEIKLDYRQNFSLQFVALSYTTPQQYSYSYKLEGYDKTWNNVGSSKSASYTNLDPGEYTFKVRASSAEGVRFGKTTTIKIEVKPPFWLTVYAYIFYGLAVIGLLLYVRYLGIQKLKREFRLEQDKNKAKQLVEQERKEAERLHELDMLKIKFLTNLSHEFRTPISLIMGPVDSLLSEKKNDGNLSQLQMIKRNARRLLNLVNQLLDFRKMEEHELKLNSQEGDLVPFIREVSDSFRDLSDRKNINLIFESKPESYYTSFDPDKLERILFNLLSNAFKFTPSGGTIRIELDQERGRYPDSNLSVVIKVTDTGIGIPADKKEKIFDRFFQSDAATSILNQGSGIGLSIAREFVKMHGGSIRAESELEMGSSFIIHLPLPPVELNAELNSDLQLLPEPEQSREFVEGGDPAPLQIAETEGIEGAGIPIVLLVEDNDDFRFYLKDNLKAFYKVYEASNGKEGWQKALALHPQIIVSDISMPFMDGIELCNKVKADKRTNHIPIILLTALTGEEQQIRGLETGANDYMTKPFNFEILNAKIKNLLVLNQTLKNTYTKQIKVQAPELVIESQSDILLNKVALYIEENLNNPKLSVEDLSKHVGMSRGSLYHKILELTGQSPIEYIRSVKLEKAAVLLEKSDMNIAQIAYQVGFATPNYFAKSFKTKFNMQPSEYINVKRRNLEKKLSLVASSK